MAINQGGNPPKKSRRWLVHKAPKKRKLLGMDLFESNGFTLLYSFVWIFHILDPMDLNQILDQGLFGPPRQPKIRKHTKFQLYVSLSQFFPLHCSSKPRIYPNFPPSAFLMLEIYISFAPYRLSFPCWRRFLEQIEPHFFLDCKSWGGTWLMSYQVGMDPKKMGKNLHRILQSLEGQIPHPLKARVPWRVWDAMQAPADL